MKKRYWLLFAILVIVVLGISLYPYFPDPYHEEGNVNVWVWLYRELNELVHGEKTP